MPKQNDAPASWMFFHVAARIWKNLPYYYGLELSNYIRKRQGRAENYICLDENNGLYLPGDSIAREMFKMIMFHKHDRKEAVAFAKLAAGRKALVDVGASGGFFSGFFANPDRGQHRILSIEVDPPSLLSLESVRKINCPDNCDWRIETTGVSDAPSMQTIISSGYGAEISSPSSDHRYERGAEVNDTEAARFECAFDTLASILARHAFVPDLVKLDIEGYEYEAILGSLNVFETHRPAIWLELHSPFIRDRGKNPVEIIDALARLGYHDDLLGKALSDMTGTEREGREHLALRHPDEPAIQ